MFTILDYSSALEYSIIRSYTNIVYYYYYYTFIQAHIPTLGNFKDTGEEPSSLHNSKHTTHTHATRIQNTTLYSDDTTHTK